MSNTIINTTQSKQLMDNTIKQILTDAFNKNASDVHISTGKPPIYRINGALRNLRNPVLDRNKVIRIVHSLLTETQWKTLQKNRELDLSCSIENVSRFRVSVFYQRGTLSLVFRVIPNRIPMLDELYLPKIAESIIHENQGLVLVTGPTGSGKSTTLASIINHMNESMSRHIITLEDPIEYEYQNIRSLIDQREVGVDTLSFINGLRASLRQDPDVILVGELRDLETISTAMTAAETGHLVLGTLHTNSATSTIMRMIDMFPPLQQSQIQSQIAATLKVVIAQQLLPTKDGLSRRPATEVLINTPAVQNIINSGKHSQLRNVLQTSKLDGMHTMEMDLQDLYQKGIVSKEVIEPYLDI